MDKLTHYELRVSRYRVNGGKSRAYGLYIETRLGSTLRKSEAIKKNNPPLWNEKITFSSSEISDTLEIRVRRKSCGLLPDRVIGNVESTISQLLKHCACGEAQLDISSSAKRRSSFPVGFLYVYLKDIDAEKHAGIDIENARRDIERIANSADKTDSMGNEIASLVTKLGSIVEAVDEVAKVHPYLNLTWRTLSAMYRIILHQFKQDQQLIELVQLMEKTFYFARDAKSLSDRTRNLESGYKDALALTFECCQFVREYSGCTFAERALKIDAARRIDYYNKCFSDLEKRIDSGLALHVASRVDGIDMRQQLEELKAILDPNKTETDVLPRCLPATRVGYLEQIKSWLSSNSEKNILWLSGIAGSGKSTIAASIMDDCDSLRRLAAFLFFRRGKEEHRSIIRSLAYQLAAFNSRIAEHIIVAAKASANIRGIPPERQFEKLLLEPLNASSRVLTGPVVIILDALDECGSESQRREILRLLRLVFPKLPLEFRFIVTSRPENDIMRSLSSREHILEVRLDNTTSDARHDVCAYIANELHEVAEDLPDSWSWDDTMKVLSDAADGLFIWASTAVKMILNTDDRQRELKLLLTNVQSIGKSGIDGLYETVLKESGISWENTDSRERFTNVLGLILLTKEALSDAAIEGLLGLAAGTAKLTLGRLRSVLFYEPGELVRPHHASFADYLTSPARSGDIPWNIDVPYQRRAIAERCFSVMKKFLHFNMCGLKTSFVRNADIPDLQDHIRSRIPSHLEYACYYWSQHLCDLPYSSELPRELADFAYQRLLFWFEVLSLGKMYYRLASAALCNAAMWVEKHNTDMQSFLMDASKLASAFAFQIAQSTPHIYVSMIPLRKDESEVAAHYSRQLSSIVKVTRRGVKKSPMWLKVLEGHSDMVRAVTVSPDGKRIASGSDDRTTRIWDIDSGEEIFMPLSGHTDAVSSVCFSPDGSRLVTGSWDKTLRIWDTQDGNLTLGPLTGHSDSVFPVTYSYDGKKIASGSYDHTVIIWNAINGNIIAGPFRGHTGTVQSVAFSPDGKKVVSGSRDKTIRIWNVETGQLVFEPLIGHTDWVWSVPFSPDGRHIASSSSDSTIRIWDVESGRAISEPFRQHFQGIRSIAYSPCGHRLVSGSDDRTIIVWDAESGEVICGPLEGHADRIYSVAFAPDGKRVVSVAGDKTIRIWDTSHRMVTIAGLTGHRGFVKSVAFSGDGSCIASAANDKTIIIWNAQSGTVVAGPLEGHIGPVTSVTFSAGKRRLVSGSEDYTIRIWDSESWALINVLQGHTDAVLCVAVSPDDTKIVSGSADKTIRVWNMETGDLHSEPLCHHSDGVSSISFSSDGKLVASGSWDSTIGIWNTEAMTAAGIYKTLGGHKDKVYSVCFSPDGTRLVSGSEDRTVIVWDVESGQIFSGPLQGHIGWVFSVTFSLDGRYVFSGAGEDNSIRIWDVKTGQLVCNPLNGHTGDILSLALPPDGSRIASAANDSTVRVWNIPAILSHLPGQLSGDSNVFADKALADWDLGGSGWILGGPSCRELFVWIPPDLRRTLWSPQNTGVLSCDFSTQLDFTSAALGDRWTECFTGSEESAST